MAGKHPSDNRLIEKKLVVFDGRPFEDAWLKVFLAMLYLECFQSQSLI